MHRMNAIGRGPFRAVIVFFATSCCAVVVTACTNGEAALPPSLDEQAPPRSSCRRRARLTCASSGLRHPEVRHARRAAGDPADARRLDVRQPDRNGRGRQAYRRQRRRCGGGDAGASQPRQSARHGAPRWLPLHRQHRRGGALQARGRRLAGPRAGASRHLLQCRRHFTRSILFGADGGCTCPSAPHATSASNRAPIARR